MGERILRARTIIGNLIVALLLWLAAGAQQPADTFYYNGEIIAMWPAHSVVEATAIQGDRFLAVGSSPDLLKTGDLRTARIDLRGQCVVTGLIDSHVHPISAALSEIDGPTPVFHSIPAIQSYIRAQAEKLQPSQVIFVPRIYSSHGYASVLNSVLLRRLEVTKDTPQPPIGRIVKTDHREFTGLIMGAPQLLSHVRNTRQYAAQDSLWAVRGMLRRYNTAGLTSIIDRGQGPDGFRVYQTMHDKGKLTVRDYVTYLINAQGTPQDVREEIERVPFLAGWGDKWVRVGSLKTIADGILIGTAHLREPYGTHTQLYAFADHDCGGLSASREKLFVMARDADRLGWQMTAQTTGSGATDLLDAYDAADRVQSIQGRRFRGTHGNFPNRRVVAGAKRLGVAFDLQPGWIYLYGPAIKDVFGPERIKDFEPLRSLLDAGIAVAGGSDDMIRFDLRVATNPHHPFFGMWMAITPKMADGNVLHPEQRISRFETLKMWTWHGAYLALEEKEKGSIEPGSWPIWS